jgi:hypothetical protein
LSFSRALAEACDGTVTPIENYQPVLSGQVNVFDLLGGMI